MENNYSINEQDLKNVYLILLAKYMEIFKLKDEIFVFPSEVFFPDITIKIEILVEAINKMINVELTERYNNFIKEKYKLEL